MRFVKFLIFAVPALLMFAQNTTQVELTDAKLAAYYRVQWKLAVSTCSEDKAISAAEKARADWKAVIESTCPAGQVISTANPDEKPSCIPDPAAFGVVTVK